jgi:hypothetical protein
MRKCLILTALMLAGPAFAAIGTTLSTINHPPMQIGTANVVDVNGRIVGAVQRVEVTPDGTPTEVAVALMDNPDKLLVLDAGKVRYDADRNQIIAESSGAQLAAMTDPR